MWISKGNIHSSVKKHGKIGDYCTIGESTTALERSKIEDYCTIGARCEIGADSIVEEYSTISHDIKVGPSACIHSYTSIHANVTKLAVIHSFVILTNETVIKEGGIVMRSPSSKELYVLSSSINQIPRRDL